MKVYFDNAATTKVDSLVLKEMNKFHSLDYGNASSLHSFGLKAKQALTVARESFAKNLNCKPEEIIFTSGGSESDNLAIKGIAFQLKEKGNHIITSEIEHPAVLETCRFLEVNGFKVSYLKVDSDGLIDLKQLEKEINSKTILVSVMHANNEIGVIQPMQEISNLCSKRNVLFHSDAVQTLGKEVIDLQKLKIDLMSFSSHKIHGPKGVGALFVREGVNLQPLIHGGGHERGLRAGTENIPGIIGFAKALDLASKSLEKNKKKISLLRDYLIKEILKIPNTRLNGHKTKRLSNNVNVSFDFIEGESLIFLLDDKEIACSTGSACSSKKLEPSHVLLALGLKHEQAHGSLRVSLSMFSTKAEAEYFLKTLPPIIKKLRSISPLTER
ncbi:MAG: cysteine desulfurase NifS [archaeon]